MSTHEAIGNKFDILGSQMIFEIVFLLQYIQAQMDKFKIDKTFNKLINILLFDLFISCM